MKIKEDHNERGKAKSVRLVTVSAAKVGSAKESVIKKKQTDQVMVAIW
jgi:hypothetical protein